MHESEGRQPGSSTNPGWSRLIWLLLLCEIAVAVFLMVSLRVPGNHDGFQLYSLQYYFLNNAIISDEIAQWMPFMTHGTVSSWWYGIQGGLLQNVLLCIGPYLPAINLTYYIHLGMLVDSILLLLGTWLLCRELRMSPWGACFACLIILGSAIWVDQPWYNVRIYYALPLIFYLGHRFLATGRWRFFALAGNLLALQTIGNLPYFIPVAAFTVCAYFVLYVIVNPGVVKSFWSRVVLGWRALLAVTVVAISFFVVAQILQIGTAEIVNYNVGRRLDGTTYLANFLSYAGNQDLRKWQECFIGVSPCLDYTLYIGVLAWPLLVVALVSLPRHLWHLPALALVLLLLASGTFVAVAFYRYWPLASYYRHLSLISPIAKVIMCIVAAYGFERIFLSSTSFIHRSRLGMRVLMTMMIVWPIFILYLTQDVAATQNRLSGLVGGELPRSTFIANRDAVSIRLWFTMGVAILAAAVLGLRLWRPQWRPNILAGIAIAVVALDVYSYKLSYLFVQSRPLPPDARALAAPQPMPFAYRRVHAPTTERSMQLDSVAITTGQGAWYWSTNSFLFIDEAGSSCRVDHWLRPFDRLLRAYSGDELDDFEHKPRRLHSYYRLDYPMDEHPAVRSVIGMTEDRVQFFSRAYRAPGDLATARGMTHSDYTGGALFLDNHPGVPVERGLEEPVSQSVPPANDRLHLRYTIRQFSANRLEIEVENDRASPAWLVYCDTWHPLWRARVNGNPAIVRRANLAYKAVRVPAGRSTVAWRFDSSQFGRDAYLIGVNSALWLLAPILLAPGGKNVLSRLFRRRILAPRSDVVVSEASAE